MTELNPLVKLDIILNFINNKSEPPKSTLKEIKIGVSSVLIENETVIIQIVDKLIKDGYVAREKDIILKSREVGLMATPTPVSYYLITFDGVSFLEYPGGYVSKEALSHAESIRLDALERRQIENDEALTKLTKWIAYGTIAAAVFAGLLLLWQVFLYFYPVHKDYPYWIWETIPSKKS